MTKLSVFMLLCNASREPRTIVAKVLDASAELVRVDDCSKDEPLAKNE